VLTSLPPLVGVRSDFHLGVEFGCDGGSSDGVLYKIIMYMDCATWRYLMLKKDLHPIYLRWFPLLQEFEFEVRDKVGIRFAKSSIFFPLLEG